MKRILIILIPLLAFISASYWIFAGPDNTNTPQTPEGLKAQQKGSHSPSQRNVPSMESMASEFEDDPLGELRLEGQVVDEDGNAIVDAIVAIDSNPTKRVTSGANGFFAIEGLVVRRYELEARKDDQFGTLPVSVTRDSLPVTLQLQRGGSLLVTALDETTRQPIVGAKVQMGNRIKLEATTDDQGKATLKGTTSWGILSVNAEGYSPYRDVVRSSRRPGVLQEKIVTLARGASVSGIVLDPAGQPVAGAQINVETNSSFAGAFGRDSDEDKIFSDEQGRWQVKALSAGSYRLRARHEKFAPGLSEPIALDGKTPKENVEIRLTQGATLSGKVVSAKGDTVASALISIGKDSTDAFTWEPNRKTYSDEKGEFKIEGIIKGAHQVVASFEEVYSPIVPVDLTSGDVSGLIITLDQDGTIIGIVVTSGSEPVPDAEVSAMPKDFLKERGAWRLRGFPQAVSDADGQFIIRGLSADQQFMLSASTNTLESANPWQGDADPVEAITGDGDIKIVLTEQGGVKGKVAFEDGSIPKEYEVSVGWNNREKFSNEDGSFELTKVSPGSVKLNIMGPGVERTDSKPFNVKSAQITDVGTITVKAGRSVRGTVIDGEGKPVAGATVMAGARIIGDGGKLSDRPRAQMKQDISKEDGSFIVGGLSSEAFYVLADHPSLGRSTTIKIEAGSADQTVSLPLLATGGIEGTVFYNGAPAKAMLTLTGQNTRGSMFTVRSEEDGKFQFDRLAAGTYLLTASRNGGGGNRFTPGGANTITVTANPDKINSYRLEIPSGVTIEITPSFEGGIVKNVSAQLIRGAAAFTDSKALQAFTETLSPDQVRQGVMMDVPMLSTTSITIEDVIPGAYTVCLSRTPTFNQVRNNTFDPNQVRPVLCSPITVAETPSKQTFTEEVPAP
jgi:protocatechuate 3,4-dioxygenase beta subunit